MYVGGDVMKIQVLSDLHLEFERKYEGYDCDSDIMVLAGDIDKHNRILESLVRFYDIYKKPIIFVPGNHEYYYSSKEEMDEKFDSFQHDYIHILNDRVCEIDDVVFIGSTGWYDESNGLVYPYIRNMTDCKIVYDLKKNDNGVVWGKKSKKFFEEELNRYKNRKVVCVSHNGPLNLPHDKYKNSGLNCCFYNHWNKMLEDIGPDIWIYGHTHDSNFCEKYDVSLLCNPKGYVDENKNFMPRFVVDI